MTQEVTFVPESLFKTHAIPRIPATFPQERSKNLDSMQCDWSHVLSYNHPFFKYQLATKKIFIETKDRSIIETITAKPFQKTYAYKNPDFLLAIALLLITLYAMVSAIFQRYLRQFFYATFLYSESLRLHNDQNATLPSFFAWLNAMAVIIFSLFLYLIFRNYDIYSHLGSIPLFLLSVGYVSIFLLFRAIVIRITGWLLDKRAIFREYLFHNLLYYKVVALFMLPILILAAFSDVESTSYALVAAAVLFVIAHVFIYSRGVKIILKKGIFIFYWILYLCTAEFVPFLLLYKYISMGVRGG
ncbi:MAG: DUF4271 domain-containing protein [Bacteroidales bacterium]